MSDARDDHHTKVAGPPDPALTGPGGAAAVADPCIADAGTADTEAGADDGGLWEPGRPWGIAVLSTLLLIGLVYLWQAWLLPFGTTAQPRHGFYPRFAGLLFVLPLVGVLVAEIRRRHDPSRTEGSWLKPVLVLATVLGYFVLAPLLGHLVTGTLVVAIVLRVVGTRAWWQLGLIALACAAGSQLLMATLLGLPLPAGRLGLAF